MMYALRSDTGRDLTSWDVRRGGSGTLMAASHYDPAIERERAAILSVIKRLAKQSINWSQSEAAPIDGISAETALAFIHQLPVDRGFPKIAPDGEGGIALVWDRPGERVLITCDRATLALVQDPGGPNSYHFSPIRFDGETIPPIILQYLPQR
jgi:hypothetical protein